MYLACDYWRKQGILDKCNVHYLSGAGVIFDIKEYAATLTDVIKNRNIKPHFGVNVQEIDGIKQLLKRKMQMVWQNVKK
jgi:sulfide:quinone oxidoreductase